MTNETGLNSNHRGRPALLPAVLAALVVAGSALHAQTGTITPHPDAKKLRKTWLMAGTERDAAVGAVAGAAGDVNRDGLADIFVSSDKPAPVTMFFLGDSLGLSEFPAYTVDTMRPLQGHPLLTGDFWGDGKRSFVFLTGYAIDPGRIFGYRLHVFRQDSTEFPGTWMATWQNEHKMPPRTDTIYFHDAVAADLDQDGADELIVTSSGAYRNGVGAPIGELLIFKGGSGFQLDTPTVILRNYANDRPQQLEIANLDGDPYPEIILRGRFRPFQDYVYYLLYFGRPAFPDSSRMPDRHLVIPGDMDGYGRRLRLLDCDGDGRDDILEGGRDVYLYRSGAGKDMLTRAYDNADADFVITSTRDGAIPLGPLNDSTGRYDMLGILGFDPVRRVQTLYAYSGGPNGPDTLYEASASTADFPELYRGTVMFDYIDQPVGDVDGNGWPEVLCTNDGWYDARSSVGLAVVLTGGPEIPRDFTSSVRDINLEGKARGLSLWPNPVREELNIAWRGDLARMPRRFEVHDAAGRSVARGDIEQGVGAALWRCAGVPAGAYFLSVRDSRGALITTERIVKE